MYSDIEFIDHYAVLLVPFGTTDDALRKAYRKRSLQLHPDKNQDRVEQATIEFDKLKKSFDILADPASREAYDKSFCAKQEAKKRHDAIAVGRKRVKETLEERERQAVEKDQHAGKRQKRERESSLRQDNMARMESTRDELRESSRETICNATKRGIVVVKWNKKVVVHNEETLRELFASHGTIAIIRVGKKKKSAIVQFTSAAAAKRVSLHTISGLKISLPGEKPSKDVIGASAQRTPTPEKKIAPTIKSTNDSTAKTFAPFESSVLERLRRAAQAQRAGQQ